MLYGYQTFIFVFHRQLCDMRVPNQGGSTTFYHSCGWAGFMAFPFPKFEQCWWTGLAGQWWTVWAGAGGALNSEHMPCVLIILGSGLLDICSDGGLVY